jgi:hypothetical protein
MRVVLAWDWTQREVGSSGQLPTVFDGLFPLKRTAALARDQMRAPFLFSRGNRRTEPEKPSCTPPDYQ